MGELIVFPVERTRPPAGVAYDLDTVSIVGDTIEEIMEDRGYTVDKQLLNDIKVLTNLAYAACRRQADEEEEPHHPFHDIMQEMSTVIDIAVKEMRKFEEKK